VNSKFKFVIQVRGSGIQTAKGLRLCPQTPIRIVGGRFLQFPSDTCAEPHPRVMTCRRRS
jgi:hypothetical protein